MFLKVYQKIIIGFYALVIATCLLLVLIINDQLDFNKPLLFYALDIGQGDSLLIRTPQNKVILIDGGPDNTILYQLGRKLPFYQRNIDLVVLTHSDADHLTGLIELSRRYQVNYVMTTSAYSSSAIFSAWQEVLRNEKSVIFIAEEIDIFLVEQDLWLEIIHPRKNIQQSVSANNNSIVMRLVYKNVSFLLMGDFEKEESLINELGLGATVLKVGHHGAENANNDQFIKTISPQFAVISAGKNNRFGHPHQIVLRRLEDVSAVILRTDILGNVGLATDGFTVWQIVQ